MKNISPTRSSMVVVLGCLAAFFFALNFLHFARGMFTSHEGHSFCDTERAIVQVQRHAPGAQARVEVFHDADHQHRGIRCIQEQAEWMEENRERVEQDMERAQHEIERAQRQIERVHVRKMERNVEALEQLQELKELQELGQLKEVEILLQDANHTLHFIQ